MSRPSMRDLFALTVTLKPVTRCEPPAGQRCGLTTPTQWMTAAEAKRHALEHPGHEVTREAVTRSRYVLEPDA